MPSACGARTMARIGNSVGYSVRSGTISVLSVGGSASGHAPIRAEPAALPTDANSRGLLEEERRGTDLDVPCGWYVPVLAFQVTQRSHVPDDGYAEWRLAVGVPDDPRLVSVLASQVGNPKAIVIGGARRHASPHEPLFNLRIRVGGAFQRD